MRYRMLSPTGDYMFGLGQANFYVNSPQAVAQSVMTRLRLWVGEYFPDTSQGMDWKTDVLGFTNAGQYDQAVQACISGTQGFASFINYSSSLNSVTRLLSISASIMTIYSSQPVPIVTTVSLVGYGVGGYSTRPYGG
jgi:hypothetical protein